MNALPYTVTEEMVRVEDFGKKHAFAKAHAGDAGFDLRAASDCWLEAGSSATVETGVRIALPDGYCGLVLPRSGLASKVGLTIPNAPGLIDSGYRGEIMVPLYLQLTQGDVYAISRGDVPRYYDVRRGDRIAQLIVVEVAAATAMFYNAGRFEALFAATERGEGGFGSSGR